MTAVWPPDGPQASALAWPLHISVTWTRGKGAGGVKVLPRVGGRHGLWADRPNVRDKETIWGAQQSQVVRAKDTQDIFGGAAEAAAESSPYDTAGRRVPWSLQRSLCAWPGPGPVTERGSSLGFALRILPSA